MAVNLFVGGLAWATTDDTLRANFEKAGKVVSAKVIKDRETGRSKGFGFVEMETQEEADAAIEMFNEKDLDGRIVKVNPAREREERQPQGSF